MTRKFCMLQRRRPRPRLGLFASPLRGKGYMISIARILTVIVAMAMMLTTLARAQTSQPPAPVPNTGWIVKPPPPPVSQPQRAVDCATLENRLSIAVNDHTTNCELQKYRSRIQQCQTINRQIIAAAEALLPHIATCTVWTAAEVRQNLSAARENQGIFRDTMRANSTSRHDSGSQGGCRVVSDRCEYCGSSTAPGNACSWYTCNARTICD